MSSVKQRDQSISTNPLIPGVFCSVDLPDTPPGASPIRPAGIRADNRSTYVSVRCQSPPPGGNADALRQSAEPQMTAHLSCETRSLHHEPTTLESMPSDRHLPARFQELDVRSLVKRLLWLTGHRNYHDCEDAVSEALLDAWRRRDHFDPSRGSLESWILGMAKHRLPGVISDRLDTHSVEYWDSIPDIGTCDREFDTPSRITIQVRAEIEARSPAQKGVIEFDMADPRGRAPASLIAKALCISTKSVPVHRYRAMKSLEKNLAHLVKPVAGHELALNDP